MDKQTLQQLLKSTPEKELEIDDEGNFITPDSFNGFSQFLNDLIANGTEGNLLLSMREEMNKVEREYRYLIGLTEVILVLGYTLGFVLLIMLLLSAAMHTASDSVNLADPTLLTLAFALDLFVVITASVRHSILKADHGVISDSVNNTLQWFVNNPAFNRFETPTLNLKQIMLVYAYLYREYGHMGANTDQSIHAMFETVDWLDNWLAKNAPSKRAKIIETIYRILKYRLSQGDDGSIQTDGLPQILWFLIRQQVLEGLSKEGLPNHLLSGVLDTHSPLEKFLRDKTMSRKAKDWFLHEGRHLDSPSIPTSDLKQAVLIYASAFQERRVTVSSEAIEAMVETIDWLDSWLYNHRTLKFKPLLVKPYDIMRQLLKDFKELIRAVDSMAEDKDLVPEDAFINLIRSLLEYYYEEGNGLLIQSLLEYSYKEGGKLLLDFRVIVADSPIGKLLRGEYKGKIKRGDEQGQPLEELFHPDDRSTRYVVGYDGEVDFGANSHES